MLSCKNCAGRQLSSKSQQKSKPKTHRRQNEYLSSLHAISLGLIRRLDVDELLMEILQSACSLAGTEHGFIYLCEPDGKEMRMCLGIGGIFDSLKGLRLKPGQGLAGEVWKNARALVVDDYRTWEGRLSHGPLDAFHGFVGIPIKTEEGVLGILGMAHTDEEKSFQEQDVTALTRFTELAAVAIHNAKLYTEIRTALKDRKKMEVELDKERKQLISMFDGMDEVVYVADPKTYELLYMNASAKKQWGEGVGQKCHRVMQNLDSPCSFCTNDRIISKNIGTSYIWEAQNTVTQRWYRCIGKMIHWPDGRLVRYELSIDIHEHKKVEKALH